MMDGRLKQKKKKAWQGITSTVGGGRGGGGGRGSD